MFARSSNFPAIGAAKVVLFFGMVCFASAACSAQDSVPLHSVQCVVVGVRSPQHAHEADLLLRGLPGVVMSRTDHNTRNVLIHVRGDQPLEPQQVNALLSPLGMNVRCWQRTPLGTVPFRHLDPRTCDPLTPER